MHVWTMDDLEFAPTHTVKIDELLLECHRRVLYRADIFDECWKRLADGHGVRAEEVDECGHASHVGGQNDLEPITLFLAEMDVGGLQERIGSPV